ncbi:MAG: hypothetical protein V7K40_14850 [Nostoc sp.]
MLERYIAYLGKLSVMSVGGLVLMFDFQALNIKGFALKILR